MGRSSHLMPATRQPPSFWSLLFLCSVTGGFALLALVGFVRGPNSLWFLGVLYGVLYGGGFATCTVHVLRKRLRHKRQEEECRARLHTLGLEFQPRMTWPNLEPFFDLPLFRIGGSQDFADNLGRGIVEGREILVVNYRYAGLLRTKTGNKVPRGALQTIALFPRVRLPDFHLTNQETDWNVMLPDWPRSLDVGRVVCMVDGNADDPVLVRSHDDLAVPSLFTEDRVKQLGDLTGWTIECFDGNLLIYRHDELMSPEELVFFVHRAIDIAGVLTANAAEDRTFALPAGGEHIQTGRPRPAAQGITELPAPADPNALTEG